MEYLCHNCNSILEVVESAAKDRIFIVPCEHCIDAAEKRSWDDGNDVGHSEGYSEGWDDGYGAGYDKGTCDEGEGVK